MLNRTKIFTIAGLCFIVLNAGGVFAKDEHKEVDQDIKEKFRVSRFASRHIELPADLPESLAISVEHDGQQKELYLWKRSVRSADYKVVGAKNGKYHHFNPGPVRTYVGVVADDPGHAVSALLDDRGLSASVYKGKSRQWQIEPLGKVRPNAARREHVVYDAEDQEPQPGDCGIVEGDDPVDLDVHDEELVAAVQIASAAAVDSSSAQEEMQAEDFVVEYLGEPEALSICELHEAEIVFVVDYTAYVKNFSCDMNAATDRVEQIVNELSVIYGRDALITYKLTGTIVRNDPAAMGFNNRYPWENVDEADPSSCTFVNDSNTCGLGFAGDWNAQAAAAGITSWHFVHLMSADNPGGILGVAYVPGTVAWSVNTVGVMAHEIGHNWGLGHCNGNGDCHIMCSGYGGCDGNPTFFGDPGASYLRNRGFSVNWVTAVDPLADPVPPRAFSDQVSANDRRSTILDVLGNDHDANCDVVTLESFDGSSRFGGTIIRSPGTGPDGRDELIYTPLADTSGEDSFSYTAVDGNGGSDTATVTVTLSDNLAGGGKASASSSDVGRGPENAVDGITDMSTAWWSDPYPQWWQVDMGSSMVIDRIDIYTWWGNYRYYQYDIEISEDNSNWTQVVDMSTNTAPSSADGFKHFITPVTARYIRVNMLYHNLNTGVHLVEVQAFGPDDGFVGLRFPRDGNKEVNDISWLSWSAANGATGHEVYFDTDFSNVYFANNTSPIGGIFKGRQTEAHFKPEAMTQDETYYWRVDEVMPDSSTRTGKVWKFTVDDLDVGPKNTILEYNFDYDTGTVSSQGGSVIDDSGKGNTGNIRRGDGGTYSGFAVPEGYGDENYLDCSGGAIRTGTGALSGESLQTSTGDLNFAAIRAAGSMTQEIWIKGGSGSGTIFSVAGIYNILATETGATYVNGFHDNKVLPVEFDLSQWNHLEVVYSVADSDTGSGSLKADVEFFVNDESMGQLPADTFDSSLSRGLGIGDHPLGTISDPWDGLVFGPKLYLGSEEFVWYDFDYSSGTVVSNGGTVIDDSGLGNDATVARSDGGIYKNNNTIPDAKVLDVSTGAIRTGSGATSGEGLQIGGGVLNFAAIRSAGRMTQEVWVRGGGDSGSIFTIAGAYSLAATSTGATFVNGFTSQKPVGAEFDKNLWNHLAVVYTVADGDTGSGNLVLDVEFFLNNQSTGLAQTTMSSDLSRGAALGDHPLNFIDDPWDGLLHSPRIVLGGDDTRFVPGDLDHNNQVNIADFSLFAAYWLSADCIQLNNWCQGSELSGDKNVNIDDFLDFSIHWLGNE